MADVKDALKLIEALFFVVEVRAFPAEGMACGGFEVAFFGHVVLLDVFYLWGWSGVFLKAQTCEP
jgi:hypothetical protein